MNSVSSHLIIGCGYLGQRLLPLLNEQTYWFTHRSQTSDERALVLDINDESTWTNLDVLSEEKDLIVYFMVPPSQIDLELFPSFAHRINALNTKQCILVSSTVVYGNTDRVVDADSDVEIESERAKRQYQIEQVWLESNEDGFIVQLAGLYGPDRIIGQKTIMQGEAIKGDPEGWLNLIHVDDAAQLIKRVGEMDDPEMIELGCDGTPIKRKEYYAFIAETLDKPLPDFNVDDQTRGIGRRCDNKLTIERTGWHPEFKNFKEGLLKSL
jgi:nucleoside-diphosphate-sugar epimerase